MKEGRMLQIGFSGRGDEPSRRMSSWLLLSEWRRSSPGEVIKTERWDFRGSDFGQEIEAVGQVPLGEMVVLCIRPENVTLSTNLRRRRQAHRNVFAGKIEKVISLGSYQKVQLDCGFPLVAYVTNHSLEELSLEEGKEVRASFKATAVTVIRKGA